MKERINYKGDIYLQTCKNKHNQNYVTLSRKIYLIMRYKELFIMAFREQKSL